MIFWAKRLDRPGQSAPLQRAQSYIQIYTLIVYLDICTWVTPSVMVYGKGVLIYAR